MKVFLSSTAEDLVAHRKVADDTILRLLQQSVVMERFGPLPGVPVDECERMAAESDILVCIVAHRCGFVPEKGRGNITRREVEVAVAVGKDVLVWIVAADCPWTETKEQDPSPTTPSPAHSKYAAASNIGDQLRLPGASETERWLARTV